MWHPPLHHAVSGHRLPGQPACTARGQGPSLSGLGQQRRTCRCQGQGDLEAQGVQDFQEDPAAGNREISHDCGKVPLRVHPHLLECTRVSLFPVPWVGQRCSRPGPRKPQDHAYFFLNPSLQFPSTDHGPCEPLRRPQDKGCHHC